MAHGGDEFVVLLPQTGIDHAAALGERIISTLESQIAKEMPQISTTLSVGISSYKSIKATDAEHIVQAADRAEPVMSMVYL